MAKTVTGRDKKWQLLDVIGQGDAGEVVRVRSELGQQTGVLKRPLQSVSGGTIVRQAVQIENEGKILTLLNGLDDRHNGLSIHTPLLLDQSIEGTARTANFFIVSEEMPGPAVSALLKNSNQGNGSFSQVLVLRVLASLFQMLKKAHARGVIWNDVKMDHIYWQKENNTFSFIDWGNGILFDPHEINEQSDPMVDFRQLIGEGTLLLNQTAPDLIGQLSWPTTTEGLDENAISQLRQRVEFLESYLSMRVIEFQHHLNKTAQNLRDIATLTELLDFKDSLEAMGVEVDQAQILQSVQTLVQNLLSKQQYQQVQEIISGLIERFSEPLGINWLMLAALLKEPQITASEQASRLLLAVLHSDWLQATSALLEAKGELPKSLAPWLMAMRNLSLNLPSSAPAIFTLLQEIGDETHMQILRARAGNQTPPTLLQDLEQFSAALDLLVKQWQILTDGEMLGDKLLKLREVLGLYPGVGSELPQGLVQLINVLLSRLRQVYQVWMEGNLDKTLEGLAALFIAEPTQNYLIDLYQSVLELRRWIAQLTNGPQPDETINAFSKKLGPVPLQAVQSLGTPPWLADLRQVDDALLNATDLNQLRKQVGQLNWPTPWVDHPWLTLDPPTEQASKVHLGTAQLALLEEFHTALRSGQSAEQVLNRMQTELPLFYYQYYKIDQEFGALLAPLSPSPQNLVLHAFPHQDHQNVSECLHVIQLVRTWRKTLQLGNIEAGNYAAVQHDWFILQDIQKVGELWQIGLLPLLRQISEKKWERLLPAFHLPPELTAIEACCRALSKILIDWAMVPLQGIYMENVNALVSEIEIAQKSFFDFWKACENASSKPLEFITQENQPLFSNIHQSLLQISRHLATVKRTLMVVNQPSMARSRLAQNSAGDLMFALVQLDRLILPAEHHPSVMQDWQKQYLQLLKQPDRTAILNNIKLIEPIHPLLPWFYELVRRDVDFFVTPNNQKW